MFEHTSMDANDHLCQLMSHICFNNYDVSQKISKVLLEGLRYYLEENCRPFIAATRWFISIKDDFQLHRIEWILGV